MLIPRAVLHPQRHCWMWLNQHNGALKHVFITLETRTKPNVDSGNEQQNGFNRYRARLFILPRCWRTTVFRRQSDRLPVWSGLICWAALKEAHFSNGKATHWYKRADLCLVGCHTRELATRDNTYVRWYISSTKFHCNRTQEECSNPYGASKAILFDFYCLKGSSTRASHTCSILSWKHRKFSMRAGGFVAPVGKKEKDKVNDIIAPSVTSFRSRPYGFMSEHTPAQLSLLFIASHLEIKIFAGEMSKKIYTHRFEEFLNISRQIMWQP